MRRRDVLASAIVSAAAFASGAEASPPKGKEEPIGQYVDVSMTAIPVLDAGRRLKNYVFVSVRLNLSPRADALKQRDREPYFRDAIVRAAHRTAFNPPDDWSRLDEARFKAMVMAEAARVAGPGVVASVKISSQQPQRRIAARPARS